MKLVDLTDDQLNAAFAEHVAGWRLWAGCHDQWNDGTKDVGKARFTTSADAVLPWLEKHRFRVSAPWVPGDEWSVVVVCEDGEVRADSASLSRASVMALLRAHGVEVEFTK